MINKKNLAIITLFICFILRSYNATSQNIDSNETIFVVFSDSDFEKKYSEKNTKDIFQNSYTFRIHDFPKREHPVGVIQLYHTKYKDFDEMDRNNPVPVFKVNKRFLKNNKDLLISLNKMKEIGYNETFKIFKKAKHIFLIDKSETDNKKVTVKEVFLLYVGDM